MCTVRSILLLQISNKNIFLYIYHSNLDFTEYQLVKYFSVSFSILFSGVKIFISFIKILTSICLISNTIVKLVPLPSSFQSESVNSVHSNRTQARPLLQYDIKLKITLYGIVS